MATIFNRVPKPGDPDYNVRETPTLEEKERDELRQIFDDLAVNPVSLADLQKYIASIRADADAADGRG